MNYSTATISAVPYDKQKNGSLLAAANAAPTASRQTGHHQQPSRCVLHASVFKWIKPVTQMPINEQMELLKRCDRFIHERHAAHALIRDAMQREDRSAAAKKQPQQEQFSANYYYNNYYGAAEPDQQQRQQQQHDRPKKRRKVYKLVDSHSTKAVSALYERYLDFLHGHSNDCRLSLESKHTTATTLFGSAVLRLRHRTNGVHTNYSNGSDEDMLDEETDAAAAAGGAAAAASAAAAQCFRFHSVDVSSIEYPDASRTVNVESGLACTTNDTTGSIYRREGEEQYDDNDDDDDDGDDEYDEKGGYGSMHYAASHRKPEQQPSSTLLLLLRYVEHPIHRHAIKLIDFVFFTAHECWSLWNDVLDRCLLVYRHKHLYPIKDSVYQIVMIQQPQQQQQHQQLDRMFAGTSSGDLVVPFHEHGLLTKLGLLVDFVNSFRVLLRYSILCCCYAMNRQANHRLHYTKKHDCYFPATSQGVYQELFLTSRLGHELLCNLPCVTRSDCFRWLATFQLAREQVCDRKKIPYTDRLRQHLNTLESSYGGYRGGSNN